MPKITIDNREVEVPPGATLLDAAQKLGIDVPVLCYLGGCKPSTSCLGCVMKIRGLGRLVPSCATVAVDGMEIESETDEVRDARRTALELLLSDHVGDCFGPCDLSCPAHMDIPLMLRQIEGDELEDAVVTVKREIALPAILGRICPKPCEKACRRRAADGAVAICQLKRYVADVDLAGDDPYLPQCDPDTGRKVAIVGGGPTGLASAYYLRRQGHAVSLLDDGAELGGRLWHETSEAELPRDVLRAEISQIVRLGIDVHTNTTVGNDSSGEQPSLDTLAAEFDAVLLSCGAMDSEAAQAWRLKTASRGIAADKASYQTDREAVFAAGNAVRGKAMVIRSAADGKEAAAAIDRYLRGLPVEGPGRRFTSRMGKVSQDELGLFLAGASDAPLRDAASSDGGFNSTEAVEQSARCLHCDCRALGTCKLKRYAELYGADPKRFKGDRAAFRQDLRHSLLIHEPGKCINCGLCIEIASAAGEPLGLSFVGRGFDVRVGVPFDKSLEEALSSVAARVAEACPTAALALKTPKTQTPVSDQD